MSIQSANEYRSRVFAEYKENPTPENRARAFLAQAAVDAKKAAQRAAAAGAVLRNNHAQDHQA